MGSLPQQANLQLFVMRGGLLVLKDTHSVLSGLVVSGAERWQNGPDVTVDYSLTDPLTRWDSYQNICNGEGRAVGPLTLQGSKDWDTSLLHPSVTVTYQMFFFSFFKVKITVFVSK